MVTSFSRGSILKSARQARYILIEELAGVGGILVLTPHPDDESVACGGAIAAASAIGHPITVVSLTDGGHSHPNSRLYPPARLTVLREAELRAAVQRLTAGTGQVISLNYPDQGTPLPPVGRDMAVQRLLDIIDDQQIGTIWTTWDGDPHPDHKEAATLARQLILRRPRLALWRFPVWGRFTEQGPAANERLVRFDTESVRHIKAAAIAAHRSQMTQLIPDDPEGFVMDARTRRHFLASPEYFLREINNV